MLREIDLKDISDGKLYDCNDLVKADCNDCKGCSACCRGMGSSIVLDPYDVYRLTEGLHITFEQLLEKQVELQVVDGLILPNIKMVGEKEVCAFLNEEGRCSIHAFRPGICRLFPLGRFYENDSFRYFLQIYECKNQNRTKVKVKKWIDTPDVKRYEQFVKDWHYFQKDLQEKLNQKEDWDLRKQVSMQLLQCFYFSPYAFEQDFYEQFALRLKNFPAF